MACPFLRRLIVLGTLTSQMCLADAGRDETGTGAPWPWPHDPAARHLSGEGDAPAALEGLAWRSRISSPAASRRGTDFPRADAIEQDLENTHDVVASRNFLLRYPRAVPRAYARRVVADLEDELVRLRVWIPLGLARRPPAGLGPAGEQEPFDVVLIAAGDFERAYGPAVSGMYYGGRIRVPIVKWGQSRGVEVPALVHELVHAVITRDVGYAIPAWLHEGLAQYLEPDHRVGDVLSFAKSEGMPLPLLDEILTGAAEPGLFDRAYGESAWIAHFIGSRFGISGFRRLFRTLADGAAAEKALRESFELSMPAFEHAFRRWRTSNASTVVLAQQAPSHDDAMMGLYEWHRGYERRVLALKNSLRRVVEAMRRQSSLSLRVACPPMLDDLTSLLADPWFYECPDDDLGRVLYEAFLHFEELALACQLGHLEQMRADLGAAEQSLRLSAFILEPYGLEP